MIFVSIVLFVLTLALAAAVSRIATDVRKIREHFDRVDLAELKRLGYEQPKPAQISHNPDDFPVRRAARPARPPAPAGSLGLAR